MSSACSGSGVAVVYERIRERAFNFQQSSPFFASFNFTGNYSSAIASVDVLDVTAMERNANSTRTDFLCPLVQHDGVSLRVCIYKPTDDKFISNDVL